MDTILFAWIHLSDIHFGHGDAEDGWDQKLVLDALRRDVEAKPGPTPIDTILVTGDVAFSGAGRSAAEYEDAKRWLSSLAAATGVPREGIFVVPGNHDVNRGADTADRNVGRLVASIRSGDDKLDTILAHAPDRKLLASRMNAYLEFASRFAPACLGPASAPEQRLFWAHAFRARVGLDVRLIGLNTALLAKDSDAGKLRLGKEQLGLLLDRPRTSDPEIVIVMSHHPLNAGWLADEKEADTWVRNNAHVHMSGHVHEPESVQATTGAGGTFVRLVAGAAHGERDGAPASHGYSLGAVVADSGGRLLLRIWPRRWSPRTAAFRIDAENVPDGQRFAEHALPLRVSPQGLEPATSLGRSPRALTFPTAAAPRTSEPDPIGPTTAKLEPTEARPAVPPEPERSPASAPVQVFLSYAPEDEALRQKLEKHLSVMKRTGVLSSFGTRSVSEGAGWKGNVDERLQTADVVLLLMSNDYLASEYCYDVEMETARLRHEAGDAVALAVLLRPTDLYDRYRNEDFQHRTPAWFEGLSRTPSNGKAVTAWPNEDDAFTQIVKDLRAVITSLQTRDKARRSS